jgi:hypothetical protein
MDMGIQKQIDARKVKLPHPELIQHHATKTYGGVKVYIHVFLTLALCGGEWSASRPGQFTHEERVPLSIW